jgi:N-acyl-D-aspartate/D-glutamate deacylase
MSQQYDVIIKDTTIVDGTGQPGFLGSVGIRGERIVAVGSLNGDAAQVIDGSGLITCPGFVDPHSHADWSILDSPVTENLVMQGITTFVGGNCGLSTAPIKTRENYEGILGTWSDRYDLENMKFGEWLSKVEEMKLGVNYVPLVGHNTVRAAVMAGDFARKANPAQIEEMKEFVDEAMSSGAFGLSAGLDYWPGEFADANELVELAKVVQGYGGFFTPHTRYHCNRWSADDPQEFGYGTFQGPVGEVIVGRYHGLLEAVEISKKANGIKLHIAHITPAYIVPQPHPEFLDEALAKATLVDIIDKARDEGLDITYNIIAWDQSIAYLEPVVETFYTPRLNLPDWMTGLERTEFTENLKGREFRDNVKKVVNSGKFKIGGVVPLSDPYWMDCFKIMRCENRAYEGKTIGDIARSRVVDNIIRVVYEESLEVIFDLLVEDPKVMWAEFIDKREYGVIPVFLKHPAGMPCTDSIFFPFFPDERDGTSNWGIPPIAYGLYPYYINRFVKETRVLSLEEAIKKATLMPAQEVLRLRDRGVIMQGAYADIVVFDYDRIREGGDFLTPTRPPEGIEYVLVNGAVVCENAKHTGARSGQVLRHYYK